MFWLKTMSDFDTDEHVRALGNWTSELDFCFVSELDMAALWVTSTRSRIHVCKANAKREQSESKAKANRMY